MTLGKEAVHTLKRIVAGLIAAVALLVGLQSIREASNAATLRKDYATTHGAISSKEVGQHGTVDYTYAVDGAEHHGRGVGGAERGFGSAVTVYYSRSDPSISSLHDPLVWQSPGWPFVAVPFAIALIGILVAVGSIGPRDTKQ